MKKVIRLTESDLRKIVNKVIIEQNRLTDNDTDDTIHYFKWTNSENPDSFGMGKVEASDNREVSIIYNLLDLGFIIEKASKQEYDEHVENGGEFFSIPSLS
jgi:hypothetical protein